MSGPIDLPVLDRESLDNSIGQTMDRCFRLAYFNYHINRSLSSRDYPISFGEAYHKFREHLEKFFIELSKSKNFYLDVEAPKLYLMAFSIATQGWEDPEPDHKKSYLDLDRLNKTCEEAFQRWLAEKRTGIYKVISTEAPFQLELPGWWRCKDWRICEFTCSDGFLELYEPKSCPSCGAPLVRRIFSGKLDQILSWNDNLWVRDWKSTSLMVGTKGNVDYSPKFNPDHQFTGYTWAAHVLSGRRVEGAIIEVAYNYIKRGPEFYPTFATRTQGDIEHWLEWIHEKFSEWEHRVRSGQWTMKTGGCNQYGGCRFKRACNMGDWSQIELWLKQNTVHSVWDPMNPDDEEGLPE